MQLAKYMKLESSLMQSILFASESTMKAAVWLSIGVFSSGSWVDWFHHSLFRSDLYVFVSVIKDMKFLLDVSRDTSTEVSEPNLNIEMGSYPITTSYS